MTRKEMKRNARRTLKQNYLILTVCCLLLAFFALDFHGSVSAFKSGATFVYSITHPEDVEKQLEEIREEKGITTENVPKAVTSVGYDNGIVDILEKAYLQPEEQQEVVIKSRILGHSRGIFAGLANDFSKGKMHTKLVDAVFTIVHSENIAVILAVILSAIFTLFVQIYFISMLTVICRRIILESRIYHKVHTKRFMFLFAIKKWTKVALAILYTDILQFLWTLTVIGGIIKTFSYMLVPYILAENPDIGGRKAVTLSRRMMNGHKWQAFKIHLSFIGWALLRSLTFGLSGFFYSNAYMMATMTEFYVEMRRLAKENGIEDADLLNDVYLYEKATPELLQKTYVEAATTFDTEWIEADNLKGIKGIIAKVFGIVLFLDKDVRAVEEIRDKKTRLLQQKDCLDGKAYPVRLFPIPLNQRRQWVASFNSSRYYTIWNLFMMFIIFCFIGWCWEVSIHLVQDGVFVNRGMLHGPWIPIYGFGGIMILIILKLLRKYPVTEFLAAIVLSGFLEYFSSYFIEMSQGKRWWDYSGYFLNLNGRICGEGLLVFGIMGMTVVYVAAPFLDHYLRKVPQKIIIPVSIVLMVLFGADSAYSHYHPNEGKGITDYEPVDESEEAMVGTLAPVPQSHTIHDNSWS